MGAVVFSFAVAVVGALFTALQLQLGVMAVLSIYVMLGTLMMFGFTILSGRLD